MFFFGLNFEDKNQNDPSCLATNDHVSPFNIGFLGLRPHKCSFKLNSFSAAYIFFFFGSSWRFSVRMMLNMFVLPTKFSVNQECLNSGSLFYG